MATDSSPARQILEAALKLPAEDRALLADELQASVVQDATQRETWLQMARQNFDEGKAQIARGEYRQGPVTEFFDELDQRLGLPKRL